MDRKYLTQILFIAIIVVVVLIVWAVFFYNPGSNRNILEDYSNTRPIEETFEDGRLLRKIGDYEITERRIRLEVENMIRYGFGIPEGYSEEQAEQYMQQLEAQALSNLTDFYIVLHEVDVEGEVNISESDIDERIEDVLDQAQISLADYLVQGKIKEDEFRTQVKEQLTFEAVMLKATESIPSPTESDLIEHYTLNKDMYIMPETVEFRQIVVPDMKTCREVIGWLDAGRSFAEVAKTYSQNEASKESGGLMPVMTKDEIPVPELQSLLFPQNANSIDAMKDGEVRYVEVQNIGIFVVELIKRTHFKRRGIMAQSGLATLSRVKCTNTQLRNVY